MNQKFLFLMKRVIPFCLILLLILSILIFPSHEWIEAAFVQFAYYFVFAAFMLWFIFLFKIENSSPRQFIKKHALGIILSFCISVLLFTISPPKFKILGDETNLLGVSMSMYQDKTSHVPLFGMFDEVFRYSIDKRPVFYPFITSIIHSVIGYNAGNPFIVNFILTICTLFLFYLFLSYFFSQQLSLISVLLIAGSPIFTFWATSGGFELLNLTFLMFVFVFFYQFLKTNSLTFFILYVLTMVLLSQCRYESIIFFIPIFILIPKLIRDKLFYNCTCVMGLALFLLVPAIWQRLLFVNQPDSVNDYLNVSEILNLHGAFSFENFLTNSINNAYVFMGIDPSFGFSPVITLLALIGIYLFIRKIVINHHTISLRIKQVALFYAISILLLIVIHFSYFWGNFSTAGSNRLALIYLPFLIFPAVYSIHKIGSFLHLKNSFILIFFIFHFIFFLPYCTDQSKIKTLVKPAEYEKTLAYLETRYGKDDKEKILIISETPGYFIVQGYGSIYFSIANKSKEEIKDRYTKMLNRVIIIQKYNYLFKSSSLSTRLDPEFRYHEVGIIKVLPDLFLKVSEIDEIIL